METMEIEGKTIDDAIEKACREFNVPREKLNIEILSEGSSGIFGIGAKKAKVRASRLSLEMELEKDFAKPIKKNTREKEKSKNPPFETSPISPAPKPAIKEASIPVVPAGTPVADKAGELLEGILKRMGFDFSFSRVEDGDSIIFKIKGDGTGALIGKGGQTLDAIQYILNKAVSTLSPDKRKIVLDTEEYRERREDYLVNLATKLAEKVKKTKRPVTVDNMNAHDRRIIHMTLQADAALTTKSRGEGSYRKIVIMPAKKGGNAPKEKRGKSVTAPEQSE